MKLLPILISASAILASCSDNNEQAGGSDSAAAPETLVDNYSETEMDKAIEKARSSIDEFHTVLSAGSADSYSVKAPISDDNGTEHFWLTDITYAGGKFTGLVGNDPGIVENVQFGQEWVIGEAEISDWMYVKSGRIHGGYTIDPLLDSFPKEEADALRLQLVR